MERQKTLETLKTVNFSMPQMISIFGLVTIFFKVHNLEIPQKALAAQSSGFGTEDYVIIQEVESGRLFHFNQDNKNEPIEKTDTRIKPVLVARKAMTLISGRNDVGELSFEGFVEAENNKVITGWVWCLDYPFMPLTVEVLEHGAVIDRIVADRFRGELQRAGKGNGEHAFRYDSQGQQAESLTFRVMDTAFALTKCGGSQWHDFQLLGDAHEREAVSKGKSLFPQGWGAAFARGGSIRRLVRKLLGNMAQVLGLSKRS